MATAKFIIDMLVYGDLEATNDPQERIWDYKKNVLDSETILTPTVQFLTITAGGGGQAISMPDTTVNWLYIESDQTINVRFNEGDYDSVVVSPSVAATSDGVFFKRGEFTDLLIYVPGSDDANVKIFMGV